MPAAESALEARTRPGREMMSGDHLEGLATARRLARFGRDLVGGGVPEAVRDAVPSFLLDYLGNAIGGSTTDSARAARRFLAGQGLHGRATAWGAGARPAQYAALANGVAAHSLEMDDTHQPSSLHPGATVFSTALAALEEIGPDRDSASRFVPAVAAGVSVHAPLVRDRSSTANRGSTDRHPGLPCRLADSVSQPTDGDGPDSSTRFVVEPGTAVGLQDR